MRTFYAVVARLDTAAFLWRAVAVITALACSGCGSPSPLAPALAPDRQAQPPAVERVSIAGRVWAQLSHGEPPLVGAVIDVREADGSKRTAVTQPDGFYRVSVRPGAISVTASKRGYEAETAAWMLLDDTVLNFGLSPR